MYSETCIFSADGYEPSSKDRMENYKNKDSLTSLDFETYVAQGDLECLQTLYRMNGGIINKEGDYCLLSIAASQGHLDCLKFLLEKNLKFDLRHLKMCALENENKHIVDYLDEIEFTLCLSGG